MDSDLLFRGTKRHPDFTDWLTEMKERGCNLLVTGEVADTISAQASRALFGTDEAHQRYRILTLLDKTISNGTARLPDETSFESPTTWIIDQRTGKRRTPTAAEGITLGLDPVETDDVRQLCDEIRRAIEFYEREADGFDPAQLRVGIDSLYPLIQENESATIDELETLCEAVRDARGMGHYHLRVPHDHEVVDELMALFDGRVELRKRRKLNTEHRWYVPRFGNKTGWMEL